MISVISVYNNVRDLANKEQRGFITPEVFNTFAAIAQQNVYNEMFTEITKGKQLRRSGIDGGRDESYLKNIKEDLSMYIREATLENGNGNVLADEDVAILAKPADFNRLISMRTPDNESIEIEYDSEKVARLLNSLLSRPTEAHPVAFLGETIRLYPSGASGAIMRYYRNPRSRDPLTGDIDYNSLPSFSASNVNGDFYIPDLVDSRDFDLPERYKGEITNEVLKMMGIRLRDPNLTGFAGQEDAAE